jgi:hypothetical protein
MMASQKAQVFSLPKFSLQLLVGLAILAILVIVLGKVARLF